MYAAVAAVSEKNGDPTQRRSHTQQTSTQSLGPLIKIRRQLTLGNVLLNLQTISSGRPTLASQLSEASRVSTTTYTTKKVA